MEAPKVTPTSPVKPPVATPAQVAPPIQVNAPVGTEAPKSTPKVEDLMKRMASEAPEVVAVKAEDNPNPNIETETDPKVKERLLNFEKHYNKKYMELAEKIKQTEAERQSLNNWTPEKIDQVLQNQQFVQAAQARLQQQTVSQAPPNWSGSQEEWSALTPSEKQHIGQLESKVNNLLTQQDQMLISQEDEIIKTRIPDYDPKAVDQFAHKIAQNQVPRGLLRELMWKAQNFDKALERSYQFGLQDRNGDIQGKMMASTPALGSANTQSSDEVPVKAENESSQNWFVRVGKYRLDQAKKSGNYTKK